MNPEDRKLVTDRLRDIVKSEYDPYTALAAIPIFAAMSVDDVKDQDVADTRSVIVDTRAIMIEFFESLLGQPEIDTYIEVAAGAALNRLRGVE